MKTILWLRLKMLKYNLGFLGIMLFMGIFLTFVFGASLGKDYQPIVYLVDEDKTDLSIELTSRLMDNQVFQFMEGNTKKEAIEAIENNQATSAIIITKGFKDDLIGDEEMSIGIVRKPDFNEVSQLKQLLNTSVMEVGNFTNMANLLYNYVVEQGSTVTETTYKNETIDRLKMYWKYKKTLILKENFYEVEEDFNYDALIHSMIGFTIFFSSFPVLYNMADILNDKKQKTLGRILLSPVSKKDYLIGNLIFTFLVGMLMISIFVFAGKMLFHINWGQHILLILLIYGAFIMAMTSLSLMVSGLVRTYGQMASISPLILTSLAMLGGCMWPLEIVSNKIMLFLANLTPHKWALSTIEHLIYYSTGINKAGQSIAVLLFMSCVYFFIGMKLMGQEKFLK